jgi:signal transduction histidine kinase
VEAVDIDKAVRDAVQLVARNHSVEVNLSSLKSISVAGHRVPLEQVISNVLLNAVEAIEESSVGSGCIDVSVESRSSEAGEAHCLLQIVDNGVGIAAESRDHLFERGFSTKPEGKRGLGLHWCANAIHAMGGKLSLESAGAGKGATALIVLPLHEPTMPQH